MRDLLYSSRSRRTEKCLVHTSPKKDAQTTSTTSTSGLRPDLRAIALNYTTYDITSYGIAPDNSCKGVVNGIGHEITPDDFLTEVEVPGYEVLTCRRLGDSGAMVLTFCGKRVPFFVNAYGQALRCYLYKRTIPHCRKCNKTGYREDVCPQPPDTPKCRVCGDSLSPNNHECRPSCMLCGGDHPTAAKPCPKRFLPPVNRRKPPRSATPTRKAQSPSPSPGRQSSASGSAARRRSRSRDKSGPSEETRHRGAVSLASRDLQAGARTGQRMIMASKAVPTRKHKR
ncbi:hypothetical protein HPB50_001306 [Hyalomma asiaticum]|uniref:Uncharacterized protein n=1 Tax=Hyalomma asiaticum TaxID=266040 RepID=A0ACB7SBE0_HYAAI|nr:hypothetical protein HPB50_001306 [Hyalomma asiaticum]